MICRPGPKGDFRSLCHESSPNAAPSEPSLSSSFDFSSWHSGHSDNSS